MEWLLLFVVAGIVAAVVFSNRLSALQRRIGELEGQVGRVAGRLDAVAESTGVFRPRETPQAPPPETVPESIEIPAELTPAVAAAAAVAQPTVSEAIEIPSELPAMPKVATRKPAWPKPDQVAAEASAGAGAAGLPPPATPRPPEPPRPPREPVDWEKTLGVRLPVWGGAIMLLIAGFFLINWAIESGAYLFTPEVRVALCGLAAAGLLAAAFFVKARGIANGERIASALATAAIAVGYGTMFLAAAVFHLVPDVVALAGAGLLAIAAIAIASQFGQRVMLVGLLGGYLSPLFAWSPETSSAMLATYVVVLLAVSMFAVRWNGWWGQAIPAIVAPALWALALLPSTNDTVLLAVFYLLLAAVPAAAAILPLRQDGGVEGPKVGLVNLGFLAASVLLALAVYWHAFDLALLVAIVLIGAGGAALVARLEAPLAPAWVASLGAGLFALGAWDRPDGPTFLLFAIVLGAIHLGALLLQFRAGPDRARRSFEIAAFSALLFVILVVKLDGWLGARDVPYLWAAIAVAIAAVLGWLAVRLRQPAEGYGPSAGFAVGASAFLSLALGLVLDPGFYALTAALQAFGLSLLYLKYRALVLKQMHVVYAVLYGVLLGVGQFVASADSALGLSSEFGGAFDFVPSVGFNEQPVTLLLLPGLLLLGAATAFWRVAYSSVPRALDVIGVVLVALAIHFLILPTSPYALFEQPLITGSWWFNVLAMLALAAVYAAWRTGRTELSRAGIGVALVVAAALAVAVMLPVFRFWPIMDVPGPPVFNVALTGIGLPSIVLLGIAWLSRRLGWLQFARGLAAFGGLGGLVTILVVIRQAIHGPTLQGPGLVSGQIELYSYSIGMLAYGFALLWAGVAFSSLALRAGSLVVVLATIGKVFFYDVGGLEGLWRVGSFLGLGIALLVVSWFYGRFVFGIGPNGAKKTPAPAS